MPELAAILELSGRSLFYGRRGECAPALAQPEKESKIPLFAKLLVTIKPTAAGWIVKHFGDPLGVYRTREDAERRARALIGNEAAIMRVTDEDGTTTDAPMNYPLIGLETL